MFPKGRFRRLVAILFVLGSARWSSSHRRSPVAAVSAVFASPVFATERNKTKQQNILKPLTSHVISIALSVILAKTHFLPIFCLLKVNKKYLDAKQLLLSYSWKVHLRSSFSSFLKRKWKQRKQWQIIFSAPEIDPSTLRAQKRRAKQNTDKNLPSYAFCTCVIASRISIKNKFFCL